MAEVKKRKPELRISGVSKKTHDEIFNIADNIGITLSQFMRPKLAEILAQYDEKMKQPKSKD